MWLSVHKTRREEGEKKIVRSKSVKKFVFESEASTNKIRQRMVKLKRRDKRAVKEIVGKTLWRIY